MVKYSDDFQRLISDPLKLRSLLDNCHYHGPFHDWEDERKFIVQAINQDGAILDIGCANGFLLRCFQAWTSFKLVPYGIDPDEKLVKEAQKLFPGCQNNFSPIPIEALPLVEKYKLPKFYNLVYWNVWDNRSFGSQKELNNLKNSLDLLTNGGRLILGFYDPSKEENLERVEKLRARGYVPTGVLENPVSRKNEMICWYDKNEGIGV